MVKGFYSYERALNSGIKYDELPELTDAHVDIMFFMCLKCLRMTYKEIKFLEKSLEDSPDPQGIKRMIDEKKMESYLFR